MKKIFVQITATALACLLTLGLAAILFSPIVNKKTTIDLPASGLPEGDATTDTPPIILPDTGPEVLPPIADPEDSEDDAIDSDSPEKEENTDSEKADKATYVRSKVDGLNLRAGPGTQYSSVGHINKGDMVTLISKEGSWYRTLYKNKTAYISAGDSYTEIFSMEKHENEQIEKVIAEGLNLLGFPYVYGAIRLHNGKGIKLSNFNSGEYDCSSLMQYIFYYGADILLNMTTRTQVTQGNHVEKSEIERGDLIFFTNSQRYNKTGVERIGHVALYLGENYILHTASDYAVIEEISARRWSYYIETRRFL